MVQLSSDAYSRLCFWACFLFLTALQNLSVLNRFQLSDLDDQTLNISSIPLRKIVQYLSNKLEEFLHKCRLRALTLYSFSFLFLCFVSSVEQSLAGSLVSIEWAHFDCSHYWFHVFSSLLFNSLNVFAADAQLLYSEVHAGCWSHRHRGTNTSTSKDQVYWGLHFLPKNVLFYILLGTSKQRLKTLLFLYFLKSNTYLKVVIYKLEKLFLKDTNDWQLNFNCN